MKCKTLKCCLQSSLKKKKKEFAKKTGRDEKLVSIDEVITLLNFKKSSLEESIRDYQLEADRYTFGAEKKGKFGVISMVSRELMRRRKLNWALLWRSENALKRKMNTSDRYFYHLSLFFVWSSFIVFAEMRKFWHHVI